MNKKYTFFSDLVHAIGYMALVIVSLSDKLSENLVYIATASFGGMIIICIFQMARLYRKE